MDLAQGDRSCCPFAVALAFASSRDGSVHEEGCRDEEGEGHEDVGHEGCSDEGYEEGDEGERGRRLAGARDEEVKGHEGVGYEGRGEEESDEEGVGVARGGVGHGEEGRFALGGVIVGGHAGGAAGGLWFPGASWHTRCASR